MAAAPRVVLVGPAGCGKTTIGRLLAERLAVPFRDGDDYHDAANIARMARGEPLDDDARAGWLAALAEVLRAHAATGCVLACSALRQRYRAQLAAAGAAPLFVHLQVDAVTLQQRLAARRGHFFPPQLLASQLAGWEPLQDGLVVDASAAPAAIVAAIEAALPGRG